MSARASDAAVERAAASPPARRGPIAWAARGWRAWVALWDRREDAAALALVRIAVAIVLLHDFMTVWRLDLIDPLWARPPDGFAAGHDGWATSLVGDGPASAHALWLAAVIALVAIACGAATRVACVGFVLVSAQLGLRAPDTERAIDLLMRITLAILALSRSHARWSVDAWVWRRLGRPLAREVPAWPRYLLLLQLIWVYFSGGINKGGVAWTPAGGFTALANVLADPHFARFDPGWIEVALPLTRVATAVTMMFELGAPAYLVLYHLDRDPDRPGRLRRWARRLRLRWLWIGAGVMFHVGIAVTMRLGMFPWAMMALYPVLLRPEELARWLRLGAGAGPRERTEAGA